MNQTVVSPGSTPSNCGKSPSAAVTTGSTDNAGTFTITYPNSVVDPTTGSLLPDTVVVEVDAHLKPGFPVRSFSSIGFGGRPVGRGIVAPWCKSLSCARSACII